MTSDVMNDAEFQESVQGLAKRVVDEVLRDPALFSQAKDVVVTLLISPDTQATVQQVRTYCRAVAAADGYLPSVRARCVDV